MILYLVRHGESLSRNGLTHLQGEEVGLSPLGKKQAKALAKFLRQAGIERIVSSSALRAKETATIIQARCRVPISEDVRLGEHVVSRTRTDRNLIRELRQKVREDRAFAPPEGESFQQAVSRFRAALLDIASAHAGDAAVVTHREVLQNFLLDEFNLAPPPPIHEASVSALAYDGTVFRALYFNKTTFSLLGAFGKIRKYLKHLFAN